MDSKMTWEEFEANGGTYDEYIDCVMRAFMGPVWDEMNQEVAS